MNIYVKINPDEAVKLQKVLEDEAFADTLNSMKTVEEIQAALKEKNVNLTIDEVKRIGEAIRAASSDGEVSESELEDVSGGFGGIVIHWNYKKGTLTIGGVW